MSIFLHRLSEERGVGGELWVALGSHSVCCSSRSSRSSTGPGGQVARRGQLQTGTGRKRNPSEGAHDKKCRSPLLRKGREPWRLP